MTEKDSRSKPAVAKPEYLTVPLPAMNGKDSPPQTVNIKSIEEVPIEPSTPQLQRHPSDLAVDALGTLFKHTQAQIAWHEAHLKRLRAALVPFAELVRQNAVPMPGDASAASGDTLQQVLEIARQLRPPEDGT